MNLTKIELENAILNALINAEELFEEALILENNKRYARAYTLFHLSIEEVGKVFVIFKYLLGNDYSFDIMKKFSNEFHQHKVKIDLSTNIDVVATWLISDGKLTAEILDNISYSKTEIENLNKLKNLSLYSFFHENSSFKPSEIIKQKDVEKIHLTAQYRIKGTSDLSKILLPNLDFLIKAIEEIKD